MEKGKIFISSTVYDFRDLRSALKYWLTELGYDVFMSESSDFPRDSAESSYQICLSTIEKCDWFILLIGDRVGGNFFDTVTNESISITRKEYRTAYKLFLQGKIKKIMTLVRRDVWNAKEERKDIAKCTKDEDTRNLIMSMPSKQAESPDEIFGFIDEVKRLPEMGEANTGKTSYPCGNWITTFDTFAEVVDTLRVELNLNKTISELVWATNITEEIKQNLKELVVTNSKGAFGIFARVTAIRNKCVEQLKGNEKSHVSLSIQECQIICGTFISKPMLSCSFIHECLFNGQYLHFNPVAGKYEATKLSKVFTQLSEHIQANNELDDLLLHSKAVLMDLVNAQRVDANRVCSIEYTTIAPILVMHDRLSNILELSFYAIRLLNSAGLIQEPTLDPFRFYENFEVSSSEKQKLYADYDEFYGKEISDEGLDALISNLEGGLNETKV